MGIESLLQQSMQNAGIAGTNRMAGNAMYPQSQMDKTQYAVSSQMPTSAAVMKADYDPLTDPLTGTLTQSFNTGGIAALRFDEGGEAPAPWDPESGQVKLQEFDKQNMSVSKTEDYTIPKDQIKTFNPSLDNEGNATGAGIYILKDGSQMFVGADGVVTGATPGRDEYTLNKDGYYQPTGSGLTWDGNANMLTKKIGGLDVPVSPYYQKGGYQDDQGGLRVDANGVPVALAPNFLDSGHGKSGLADAAPYIAAAAMLAATGMPTGFEGMVPASETLMGGFGAGATTAGAGAGDVFAGWSPTGSAAGTAGTTIPAGGYGAATAAAPGLTLKDAYSAYKYGKMGLGALNSLSGSSGGSGGTSAASGNQGINNPYAMSTGFNPGPVRSGLGIDSAPQTQTQPTFLSKLSEFRDMASGGIAQGMAQGGMGHLGSYSDGGRLLKGPGDGMSDNIPATIGAKQPARLAEGEFVVPADVVSHLGNGSTDAGAKQLYKMMDNIRKARTGNPKQGKQINPDKFTPKG